jgi:hypothetical protein
MAQAISSGRTENTFASEGPEGAGSPPSKNRFVVAAGGKREHVGFFEQDDYTGYLYVFDKKRKLILSHLQVYTCAARLGLSQGDVKVIWSADGKKCGVVILEEMRGIIDLGSQREGRSTFKNRGDGGVNDFEWLQGFEAYGPVVRFPRGKRT